MRQIGYGWRIDESQGENHNMYEMLMVSMVALSVIRLSHGRWMWGKGKPSRNVPHVVLRKVLQSLSLHSFQLIQLFHYPTLLPFFFEICSSAFIIYSNVNPFRSIYTDALVSPPLLAFILAYNMLLSLHPSFLLLNPWPSFHTSSIIILRYSTALKRFSPPSFLQFKFVPWSKSNPLVQDNSVTPLPPTDLPQISSSPQTTR